MQLRFTQMLAALRQALHFLDANYTALGNVNASGARRDLDAVTNRLDALATEQVAHRIQGKGELLSEGRLGRAMRRKHLKPIVKAARRKLPNVAQLEAVVLPPLRSNSTDLVTRARAMADAVTPYKDGLHEAGLDADFLEQLHAAADQLTQTIALKGEHRAGRIGATDAIFKEVRAAREAVNLVDARVQGALDEEDPLITEWKAACRTIRRAAVKALEPQPVGGTPVGGTPAPAPAGGTPASGTPAGGTPSPVSASGAPQAPAPEKPKPLKLVA
jgi:hypothetical protein